MIPRTAGRVCAILLAGAGIAAGGPSAAASTLTADDLALVVNRNEPAGLDLAQFYARVRHVPDGRILQLDLPKSEAISFRTYDTQVLPLVRAWLNQPALKGHVKGLVTFYGMPLRIDARTNTPDESTEQQMLRETLAHLPQRIEANVVKLETTVHQQDGTFQPNAGSTIEALSLRAGAATNAMRAAVRRLPPGDAQEAAIVKLLSDLQPLVGDSARLAILQAQASVSATSQPATRTATTLPVSTLPVTSIDVQKEQAELRAVLQQAAGLQRHRDDADARQQLRTLALQHLGLFGFDNLLSSQLDFLNTTDTGSALDSELALAEWPPYSRVRWRANPLFYASGQHPAWTTLRVMRLDAPTPTLVHDLVLAGLQVEDHGLHGQVVIDARGLSPNDPSPTQRSMAQYDGYLVDLAKLLQEHTKLQVLFDDKPDVLPAGSAADVALYCGWYSVHHYVPACKFVPGAVGYHIASYELLSLHTPGETGWVAGLMNDGIAATLGPVAEPYLQSFPRPDDFFPLLLTGKLPLADVYWATTPMTSWMQTMIGDPLYTPYKATPALKADDLPPRLAGVLEQGSADR